MNKKLRNFLGSRSFQLLCRLILGGIFIYSSLPKIANPHEFAKVIYDYRLVPEIFIYSFAIVLPWLEMISGLYLISGFFIKTSTVILSSLLVVFLIALSINAIRGLDINCGCFSISSEYTDSGVVSYIIRDVLFLIPGLLIILFNKSES